MYNERYYVNLTNNSIALIDGHRVGDYTNSLTNIERDIHPLSEGVIAFAYGVLKEVDNIGSTVSQEQIQLMHKAARCLNELPRRQRE